MRGIKYFFLGIKIEQGWWVRLESLVHFRSINVKAETIQPGLVRTEKDVYYIESNELYIITVVKCYGLRQKQHLIVFIIQAHTIQMLSVTHFMTQNFRNSKFCSLMVTNSQIKPIRCKMHDANCSSKFLDINLHHILNLSSYDHKVHLYKKLINYCSSLKTTLQNL